MKTTIIVRIQNLYVPNADDIIGGEEMEEPDFTGGGGGIKEPVTSVGASG